MSDDAECRLCRCGEEVGLLFHPCACKGSIQYVHEACLVTWLRISDKRVCELCLTEFEFKTLYEEHAPSTLSSWEIMWGSLQLGMRFSPDICRYALVTLLWCFVFPLLTCRVYRLFSSYDWNNMVLVWTDWSPDLVLFDCLHGLFISSAIACALLMILVLHEYVGNIQLDDIQFESINLQNIRERFDSNLFDIADRVVEAASAVAADANERINELQSVDGFNRIESIVFRIPVSRSREHLPDVAIEALVDEAPDDELGILLGLRGGITRGLYSLSLILLVNIAFLLTFVFVPLSLGRFLKHTVMFLFKLEFCEYQNREYLALGYTTILLPVIFYVVVHRLMCRRTRSSQDNIVYKYAASIFSALCNLLLLGCISFFELFLLSEVVGWIAHFGVMGASGDTVPVMLARIELCHSAPFTCIGIHWAVGSVLIVNWAALIWAFRQVVHPCFQIRFFSNKQKKAYGGFAPLFDMRRLRMQEQSKTWIGLINKIQSTLQQSVDEVDDSFLTPAVFGEVESPLQDSMISHSMDGCLDYISMIILWSIPAMLVFLWAPILCIKWISPGVFPIRMGSFKEPFIDAQLPLDIFLFVSVPLFLDRLGVHTMVISIARIVGKALTSPLDLEGYVMRPLADFLRSGFIRVDVFLDVTSKYKPLPELVTWEVPSSGGSLTIDDPISTVKLTSRMPVGTRVNIVGVIAHVSHDSSNLYMFTITDSLGYCIPVLYFAEFHSRISPDLLNIESIITSLKAHLKDQPKSHALSHEKFMDSKPLVVLRLLLDEFNDDPEMLEALMTILPQGVVGSWSHDMLRIFHEILRLWENNNPAPVVALRNVLVSNEGGRSLVLDGSSTIALEPDLGHRYFLARASFDSRRAARPHTGQFCIWRHQPQNIHLRLRLLAILSIFAGVLASVLSLSIPLIIGRILFEQLNDPFDHDIYHWIAGSVTIFILNEINKWSVVNVYEKRLNFLKYLMNPFEVLLKWGCMVLIFVIVLPLLFGVLFELVVLNSFNAASYPVENGYFPQFSWFQNWGIGLVVGRSWSRMVGLGLFGEGYWFSKFEGLRLDFGHTNLRKLCLDVAFPLVISIAIRILVPYLVAISFLKYFPDHDTLFASKVLRNSFPVFSCTLLGRDLMKSVASSLHFLHDIIRDNRYKIGQQLQNRFQQ